MSRTPKMKGSQLSFCEDDESNASDDDDDDDDSNGDVEYGCGDENNKNDDCELSVDILPVEIGTVEIISTVDDAATQNMI